MSLPTASGHVQLPENTGHFFSMPARAHRLRGLPPAAGDGQRPTGGVLVLARPRQWRAAGDAIGRGRPRAPMHAGLAWFAHAMGAH